jgi:hydroxyacylglutathione hydrolase
LEVSKMQEKGSVVIPIPLGFVNAFVLRGSRPILVDTGLPGSETTIVKKLSQNGISPQEISLILITHGHADHFGSAAALKKLTGAPVAIHKLDAEFARKGIDPPVLPANTLGRLLMPLLARRGPAKAPPVEPDILIEGETSLGKYGVDGKVIPTPGHTPGSVSVLLPGGDVIIGDLVMRGILGGRSPDYPMVANDVGQLKESLRLIMRGSPTRIFSGHGGPFNPEAVRRRFGIN